VIVTVAAAAVELQPVEEEGVWVRSLVVLS